MNNPLRALVQKRFEGPRLRRMGGTLSGGIALEIGCGRGVGIETILEQFGATRVDGIDLDPRMIHRAKRRLRGRPVKLRVGDVTSLETKDTTYDAVFDFGIIHHVPNWRKALSEVCRVLKPEGRFYAEEVLRDFINKRPCRALFDHPWEDRFDHEEFTIGLVGAGFKIVSATQLWNRLGWYIADKRIHRPN